MRNTKIKLRENRKTEPNKYRKIFSTKGGDIRIGRKLELCAFVNYLMNKEDDDFMFNFLNYNISLLKEERDYMTEIYNRKIDAREEGK